MTTKFERVCQTYMPRLMKDLDLPVLDAAAVFGNGGYESGGFTKLQEIKPVVRGSRGGYGWFQWTGPRRRSFESFVKVLGLPANSDEANYQFLISELKGPEKRALAALRAAPTLDTKTVAFEESYERAGVKAYPKRKEMALAALHAYERTSPPAAKKEPEIVQPVVPTTTVPTHGLSGVVFTVAVIIGGLIAIPLLLGG